MFLKTGERSICEALYPIIKLVFIFADTWRCFIIVIWPSLVAQTVKNLPAIQETWFDP